MLVVVVLTVLHPGGGCPIPVAHHVIAAWSGAVSSSARSRRRAADRAAPGRDDMVRDCWGEGNRDPGCRIARATTTCISIVHDRPFRLSPSSCSLVNIRQRSMLRRGGTSADSVGRRRASRHDLRAKLESDRVECDEAEGFYGHGGWRPTRRFPSCACILVMCCCCSSMRATL